MDDTKLAEALLIRDHELGLLGWEVIEPINGGSDWYVTAAFEHAYDAYDYADWRNSLRDSMDYSFEVRQIGTKGHPVR